MTKTFFIWAAALFLIVACNESPRDTGKETGNPKFNEDSIGKTFSPETPKAGATACGEGESLIYQDENFESFTEDRMRGQGIISFTLVQNDRLTILNKDDSNFGEIVLNEDMTYFTLTMPKKVLARTLITNSDFATFDFDAEKVNADKDFLFIYVNKEKRKVKKSDLKFTFSTWEDYIKVQTVKLKDCNLPTDVKGKANLKSKGLAFLVTEIKGNEMKIKSIRDCLGEDGSYQDLEGKVKWKSGNALIVNLAQCN